MPVSATHDLSARDLAPGGVEPASIVVVQPGRFGDVVLTTPLLRALSLCYPSARITVISAHDTAPVLAPLPFVDVVVPIARGLRGYPAARRVLSPPIDIYIDPKDHRSTSSRLLARTVNASLRVVHPDNDRGRRPVLPLPRSSAPRHYAEVMLDAAKLLCPGLPEHLRSTRPTLVLPDEAMTVALSMPVATPRALLLNISAGSPTRHRSEAEWLELARALTDSGWSVTLLAVGDDRALAASIAAHVQRVVYAPTSTFMEAAAVVSRASGLITPDTSLVHVASAFDVPTVGLYPADPENLARFAPLATRHAALTSEAADSFSFRLDGILEAVERVLG